MTIDEKLKNCLQERGSRVTPPPGLKSEVMDHINSRQKRWKRRLATGAVLLMFFVPTTTIAYQSYGADSLYGSYENLKKHISTATMKGYFLLDAKFAQAQGELEEEEYEEFKGLLKEVTEAKLTYADSYGNIDYTKIPAERVKEMRNVLVAIQPYFDQLNSQPSSKEVLTAEEYSTYIDALMLYETILSQNEIDTSNGVNVEELPEGSQEIFLEVRNYLEYVNDKQIDSAE
ncbi:DUF3600 domain-containing protein [Bacillus sp. KH172YL63]|uniref:DUF3600 domain-containing protein n=1 Tax=Bacillus sp. KH172YL63 TaxID=2709784 RepID=UPI0013E4436F|nr:DUF3600 domain-containing protein [Bacillus sp. KH172YL63]BCB02705.1 hypothetical protein KH172YL63_08380 [Bacillus sp. KH172YL63]